MKFKHFPKIYRFFAEDYLLSVVVVSAFLFAFVLVGVSLMNNFQKMVELNIERNKIASKIYYWRKVVEKYKEYRDGYFQLAILEYQLQDIGRAKVYLREVLRIDPSFEKGRMLQKAIGDLSMDKQDYF